MFTLAKSTSFSDKEFSCFELKAIFRLPLDSQMFDQAITHIARFVDISDKQGGTQYLLTTEDASAVYRFKLNLAKVCAKITIKNAGLTYDAYLFRELDQPDQSIICSFRSEDLISILPLLTNLLAGALICSRAQTEELHDAFNLTKLEKVIDEARVLIDQLISDKFCNSFWTILDKLRSLSADENVPASKEVAKLLFANHHYNRAISILDNIVPSFNFPSTCQPNHSTDLFVRSHVEIIKISLESNEDLNTTLDKLNIHRHKDTNPSLLYNIAILLKHENHLSAAACILTHIEAKLTDKGKDLLTECQFELASSDLNLFAPIGSENKLQRLERLETILLNIEKYGPGAKPIIGKIMHELAGYGAGYLCDREGPINLHNYTDINEIIRLLSYIREQNQLLEYKDLEIKCLKEQLATSQKQNDMGSAASHKQVLTAFRLNTRKSEESEVAAPTVEMVKLKQDLL